MLTATDDEVQGAARTSGFVWISWRSVSALLIALIVTITAADQVFVWKIGHTQLERWGFFTVVRVVYEMQVWRLVTFPFLHDIWNPWHLIFNCFVLALIGPMVERRLGHLRFAVLFLLSGIAGAAVFTVMAFAGLADIWTVTPMIGAGAGVYGLLAGATVLMWGAKMRLIFRPIVVQIWMVALGLLVVAVLGILTDGDDTAAEAIHLGGAAGGFALTFWRRGFLDRVKIPADCLPWKGRPILPAGPGK